MKLRTLLLLAALSAGVSISARAEIVRHPIPNSTFPIAQVVQVTGNVTTYYVSGQVPPAVNKDADPSAVAAYGDIKTQTVGVLNRIKGILEGLGLSMGDVVKMQVFLVHSPSAPMDFKRPSWRVTPSSSAAASLICRRARWSAWPRSPIPASWSRSR
jgi:enamine deaminase RidA (YjgF/YER057c/UK114 family)